MRLSRRARPLREPAQDRRQACVKTVVIARIGIGQDKPRARRLHPCQDRIRHADVRHVPQIRRKGAGMDRPGRGPQMRALHLRPEPQEFGLAGQGRAFGGPGGGAVGKDDPFGHHSVPRRDAQNLVGPASARAPCRTGAASRHLAPRKVAGPETRTAAPRAAGAPAARRPGPVARLPYGRAGRCQEGPCNLASETRPDPSLPRPSPSSASFLASAANRGTGSLALPWPLA